MSGALLFCTIVLLCWSMSSQLTTWTSSVVPVFSLYLAANWVQNADVWSLEYSAATSLIDLAGAPDDALPSAVPAPVPPPQAARVSATPARPAASAGVRLLMRRLLSGEGGGCRCGDRVGGDPGMRFVRLTYQRVGVKSPAGHGHITAGRRACGGQNGMCSDRASTMPA